MRLSQCIETFLNSNNVVNNVANNSNNLNSLSNNEKEKVTTLAMFLAIIILVLLNITVGPYLWNNVLRRLIPSVRESRWYEMLALCVLLSLIIPH